MIYLIAARDVAMCKIGTALNPARRVTLLQTGCPFDLELIATRPGDGQLERLMHAAAAAHHVKREWFRFNPAIVELFHSERLEPSIDAGLAPLSRLIRELGGASAVSRELGIPMTTVASWFEKGRMPAYRWAPLRDLAASRMTALSETSQSFVTLDRSGLAA